MLVGEFYTIVVGLLRLFCSRVVEGCWGFAVQLLCGVSGEAVCKFPNIRNSKQFPFVLHFCSIRGL